MVSRRSVIAYTSPNLSELKRIVDTIQPGLSYIDDLNLSQTIEEIQEPLAKLCLPLLDTTQCIMITLGKLGMMVKQSIHTIKNNSQFLHNLPSFDRLYAVEQKQIDYHWLHGNTSQMTKLLPPITQHLLWTT